ncbi:MAG: hypothetical protein ACQERI_05705 [Candidatus Krumholzibacteriota bacterium]
MKMRNRALSFWLLFLMAIFPAVSLFAAGIEIDGYFKNFQMNIEPPQYLSYGRAGGGLLGANTTRLRIDGAADLNRGLKLFASYTASANVLESSLGQLLNISTSQPGYRIDDIRSRIYPAPGNDPGSLRLNQNLDRFYIAWSGPLDLYLGRQPFGWGAGKTVNPTDVLAPFRFDELDREERVGLDALRAIYPLGVMSEIDAGVIPGEDAEAENSAAYLRGRTYLARTDFSATVIIYRENFLAGLDAARSVGGSGVWLEAAYNRVENDFALEEFVRLVAGWDRSFFQARMYTWCEYHYNGAGAGERKDYYSNINSHPAYGESGVFLMGRHYLLPAVTWQFTPLISGTGQFFINLADGSVLFAPALEYNIGKNIYLGGGGYLGFGESSGQAAGAASEFGEYGRVIYFSMRYYY